MCPIFYINIILILGCDYVCAGVGIWTCLCLICRSYFLRCAEQMTISVPSSLGEHPLLVDWGICVCEKGGRGTDGRGNSAGKGADSEEESLSLLAWAASVCLADSSCHLLPRNGLPSTRLHHRPPLKTAVAYKWETFLPTSLLPASDFTIAFNGLVLTITVLNTK